MKQFKNIIEVAVANIINFGSSFIVGFLLPGILTVASYGKFKEFTLYLSFVYLFNLGFNDGIYIKYGGEVPEKINKRSLHEEHTFVIVFQSLLFLGMIIFSYYQQNMTLIIFSIITFVSSIVTFHQNFLQAIGEFKTYSKGSILRSSIYIILLLVAIFIISSDNYIIYISILTISYFVMLLYYEFNFYKEFGVNFLWDLSNKFNFFSIGFFILVANLSLTFVGNIGNWFVNFGFAIEDFAQYSFQNSVLNVILLVINAVGMVFYNVISKRENKLFLKVIKELSLLLGIFAGAVFFIFVVIIEKFLPDYTPAISLLSMTFMAIPYIMLSKILIANVYKSTRSERKYFKDSILFAIFSFLFVGGIYLATNNMIAIALATTFCYIFWYVFTTRIEFNYLSGGIKELLLLVSHLLWFYMCSNIFSTIIGFFAYLIYLGIILIVYSDRLKEITTKYLKS